MSPQKEQKDWTKISTSISAIIQEHTPEITVNQQSALIRRFIKIIEHFQSHSHTDNIVKEFSNELMPLDIDITYKAALINKALEAVETFLEIKPLWHTSGTDQ